MERSSRSARLAAGAFLLLCVAWYGWRCWMLQRPSPAPSDFQFYYAAAGRVRHGGSPYIEGGYVYPPLLALVLVPLTRFDYLTARRKTGSDSVRWMRFWCCLPLWRWFEAARRGQRQ